LREGLLGFVSYRLGIKAVEIQAHAALSVSYRL